MDGPRIMDARYREAGTSERGRHIPGPPSFGLWAMTASVSLPLATTDHTGIANGQQDAYDHIIVPAKQSRCGEQFPIATMLFKSEN